MESGHEALPELDRFRVVTGADQILQCDGVDRDSDGVGNLLARELFNTRAFLAVLNQHPIKQPPIAVVEGIPKPISFKLWRNCRFANSPADTASFGDSYGKQKRKGFCAEFVGRPRYFVAPVNGHNIAICRALANVMEKDTPTGGLHLEHLTDHR